MGYKLKKEEKSKIEKLLNNNFVDNYHKTLLKSILKNNEKNNLQKADFEMLPLILKKYGI